MGGGGKYVDRKRRYKKNPHEMSIEKNIVSEKGITLTAIFKNRLQ